jgi:hypothetical protein
MQGFSLERGDSRRFLSFLGVRRFPPLSIFSFLYFTLSVSGSKGSLGAID